MATSYCGSNRACRAAIPKNTEKIARTIAPMVSPHCPEDKLPSIDATRVLQTTWNVFNIVAKETILNTCDANYDYRTTDKVERVISRKHRYSRSHAFDLDE